MPYDVNGRAYDREDAHDGMLMRAVGAAIAAILAIAAIGAILSDAPREEPAEGQTPAYELRLDCSNAALMHRHGLPTKADVMQWHLHGQWGFYWDGILHSYDALPGSADTWDELYGIDSANKAFEK